MAAPLAGYQDFRRLTEMRSNVVNGKAVIGALAALVFVLAVGTAAAQTQDEAWKPKPRIGIKGGVNFSSAEVTGGSSDRTGGLIGGFVTFPLSYLGLQMEALISQKGFTQGTQAGATDWEVKYTYFELPVLLRGDVPLGEKTDLYVFAGAGIGFLFNAEQRDVTDDGDWEDISDSVSDTAWAWRFGVGFEISRFLIEGSFSQGISNLADVDAEFPEFKDRTTSLLVGFLFGK
jgi:opacity protein-like surface antigen